jgi:hypothetical protein
MPVLFSHTSLFRKLYQYTTIGMVSMAGGGGLDVRPGEEKLPAAQAGAGHACDAPRDTGRSQGRLARTGPLGTAENCFYRASESDRPSWGGSAGTPHLGHGPASPTTPGPPGMVASLLSFCASPCIATDGAHAATRTGGKLMAQRYQQCTPAMAAGRTNRRRTVREVLSYPLPPMPCLTI